MRTHTQVWVSVHLSGLQTFESSEVSKEPDVESEAQEKQEGKDTHVNADSRYNLYSSWGNSSCSFCTFSAQIASSTSSFLFLKMS